VNRQTLVAALLAIAIVGGLAGGMLYWTRKNHLELTGQVLKVRSHMVEPQNTMVAIDFRVTNPSTNEFVVRAVEVFIEDKEGKSLETNIFPEVDARRLFTYYPVLGKKFNQTLVIRDKIEPGQTLDRMIAVGVPITDTALQERKGLRIEIEDLDGSKSVIREERPSGSQSH
jgi:hypothetical protein